MLDRGHESFENRRVYDTSSPVVECSDCIPNPTHNGKLWVLSNDYDDDDDHDDDRDDDSGDGDDDGDDDDIDDDHNGDDYDDDDEC